MNQRSSVMFFLAFIICCVSSCAPTRYYSTPHDDVYLLADYEDTLHQWITHDEIHNRFISIADASALYLSWEVRQGFINAVRDRMNPDPQYLQEVIQRNLRQFENGNEFYFGLYCYEEDWCKMTGLNPVWYLSMSTDSGITVRPSLIEQTELRAEQAWLFLDELTHGRKLFRVVFPTHDDEGRIVIDKNTRLFYIKCHSLLGTMTFRWDLVPIPQDLD
ncbi:hypothetical protein JW823_06790 [bacterium]|nr:hypothetical protein [candidate division CSSED10-310 bacterium]